MQGQREEGESERGPGQKLRKRWERSVLSVLSALSSVRVRGLLPYCCWYRLVVFFGDLVGSPPHYCTITTSPLLSSLLHPEISCYLLLLTTECYCYCYYYDNNDDDVWGRRVCVRVWSFFIFSHFFFLLALYGCMYVCGDTYVDVTRYEEEARTSKGIEESR